MISKNFKLEELVSPIIFKQYREKSIWFLEPRIIVAIQTIRNYINTPIKINDWADGGTFKNSGLRPFNCAEGAKYSQHKFGRAMDLKQTKYTNDEFRQIIKEMHKTHLLGLVTAIENNTPTWVHIDCRNTGNLELMEFDPS
jgi:hypothetical protein